MLNIASISAFVKPLNLLLSKQSFSSRLLSLNIATSIHTKAPKAKSLINPKDLLDKTDVFIFDCDGVIWKGDSLIEKVPQVLDKLRAAGKTIFFVTNNSTKSRKGYLKKFTGLGLNVKAEGITLS